MIKPLSIIKYNDKGLDAIIFISQGDIRLAIINTARLAVNSTVGLLGTIDVANKMGFPKYVKEDYGQTLGAWGVGPGCYIVLPVLGPSTVRDTVGSLIAMIGGDVWHNITVRDDEEYTSPIEKLYKIENAYVILTANSIYLVHTGIQIKSVNLS